MRVHLFTYTHDKPVYSITLLRGASRVFFLLRTNQIGYALKPYEYISFDTKVKKNKNIREQVYKLLGRAPRSRRD